MKLSRFLILLAFFLPVCAFGQSTTVSGTIVDGGGQAWFAGTYSFVFLPNPNFPTSVYTWSGGAFSKTLTGQLNGSGAYSASIPQNSAISPQGSSWSVTFCPQASSQCTTPVPLTLVSPTLTYSPTPPAILISLLTAVPPISAYTDSEITGTIVGSTYYNLTLAQIRICMTASGNSCGVWAIATVTSATNLTGPGTISGTFGGSPTLTGPWTFTNSITDNGLTAGNCVQAGTAGLLTTVSVPCATVSTTGSPVSGNLTKFSGGTSITNGDLSGDISTSGTLVTTLPNIATAGTNTKLTFNAKGQVTTATAAQLASADFANQGTVHGIFHGNAAGNPSFGQVDLTSEVSNTLPSSQLGASSSNCTGSNFAQGWNAGGTPICTASPTTLPAVLAYSVTTESSDTALSSGVQATVITKAVTMPSSGCPCRVSISWYQFVTLSGSSGVFEALVSDGTNVMAESEWGISLNNGPSGGGDGWSPVTYANNAAVTFTLKVQADTGSVTARAAPFHAYGARNSRLEISVLSSN